MSSEVDGAVHWSVQSVELIATLTCAAPDAFHAVSPPLRMRGPVIHGFKRGSKELGIPTANLDADALKGVLDECATGVYFGWASVGRSDAVFKMVMSIGWCVYCATSCKRRTNTAWQMVQQAAGIPFTKMKRKPWSHICFTCFLKTFTIKSCAWLSSDT
jgi:hypothetical protein